MTHREVHLAVELQGIVPQLTAAQVNVTINTSLCKAFFTYSLHLRRRGERVLTE